MHRRLLTLARDSRLALIITILSGLLAGILTIWQARALSQTVERVFLGGGTLAAVTSLLLLLLVIISLRSLLACVSEVSANSLAVRVKSDLRRRLFAHIIALGPAYTRGERTGELTAVVVEGVEALDAYFSQYLPQLVLAALVPLSILIFVFPLDPLSALVLLLTAPLIPVFMYLIGKAAESLTNRQWETLSRLSAHFLDSLQGLTTLKLFSQSRAHARTIKEASDHFRDTTLSVLRVTFLSALALEMVATLSTAVVAVEVGLRLLYARMTFEEAFFLLILAPEFYLPLRMLGLRFHAGMAGTSAARRIFEILDKSISGDQVSGIRDQERSPYLSLSEYQITFNNVSFNYEPDGLPALQDISLTIHAGQKLALVGPSGAGKSTLAQLLLRFIEPTEGLITIDNVPLNEISTDAWRAQIAWVPQQPYLFHDMILANLRLAQPGASLDTVIAAAQAAQLDEFIQSLPAGYETMIGEGGARLSGGQAQRLALARAFLKNAPILILDEPTSSLDPENEAILEEATHQLMQGRTVITIAHRLNTVYKADQIIVLQAGRIAERGTHHELIARSGLYAELVRAHAKGYDDLNPNHKTIKAQRQEEIQAIVSSPLCDSDLPGTSNKHGSDLLRLLGFLRGSWGWVTLSVLLGTITIGSSIGLMGTSAYMISAAALHLSIADLQVAIVGVRFFGIARGVFRYLERLVSHNVTFRLLARLRIWFYQALEPLAPARLMQYRSGDLLSRIVADVETLEDFYIRVVSPPLVALLVSLGMTVFMTQYHPALGISLLTFLLGLGLGIPLLIQFLSRRPGGDLVALRADLHIQLVDGIQGLADLLAYGRAADRLEGIKVTGGAYGQVQRRMALLNGLHAGLSILISNLGMWLVLLLAIPLVSAGMLPGVLLAMLVLVTLSSFEVVTPLPLAAQVLSSTTEASRRLFAVVEASPTVTDPPHPLPPSGAMSLAIHDLRFRYAPDDPPALDGIDFSMSEGSSLAIVGPSGAGKSTLVGLLLRFWDYHAGEIILGGHDLRQYAQDDIRRQLSVVSQNTYFFNATIRANLCLARPGATEEELIRSAQQSHIHEFILSLPKGYETFIGEQGLRLSGGERQRLAIARALLKDAPLLILDEPAANLDPLTERQLLETLFVLMGGRSILLITHRLVGLEHFDQILVMDHGQIVERGRHAELLAGDGLYRRLWDLQNRILSA